MPDLPRVFRRPPIFTFLGGLQFVLGAGFFVLGVWACVHVATQSFRGRMFVLMGLSLIAFSFTASVLHVLCGTGLWKLRQFGWSLLRAWSVFILILIPIGTLIGILLLSYLNSPGVRILYSERAPEVLSQDELRRLKVVTQSAAPMITAASILALIGLFAIVGVVVSRFLPESASPASIVTNQMRAIEVVEAFAAAEAAYADANGGRFGTPECLSNPEKCVAGFSGSIAFDLPSTLAFERHGYAFQFFAPETIDVARARREGADLGRLEQYVFLALPTSFARSTQQIVCVDGSGRVRITSPMRMPPSTLGACPSHWQVLKTISAER